MERIFYQNQTGNSTGSGNSGVLIVSWQTLSLENESVTLAVVSVECDSRSSSEYATCTGAPLLDDLARTGVVTSSVFVDGFVVTNSSSIDLQTVVSNLVESINRQENWYATCIISQTEI